MLSLLFVGILIVLMVTALSSQSKTSENSEKNIPKNNPPSKPAINLQEHAFGKKHKGTAINSEGRFVKVNYYETFPNDSTNYKTKAIACEIYSSKAGLENVIEERKIVEINSTYIGEYIAEFLSTEKIHLNLFEKIVTACSNSTAFTSLSLARELGSIYTNNVSTTDLSKPTIMAKLRQDIYSKFGSSL